MAVLKPVAGSDFYLWKYLPSVTASSIFLALFVITLALHVWRIFRFRSYFCLAFAFGCLSEIVGFATRAAAYYLTDNIGIYVIQATLLVLAPVFFAVSIYMTLSRIIRCVKAEHLSIIQPSRLTKTFVWGDIFVLAIQSGGASLTSRRKTAKYGEYIVVAGLFTQIALLTLFFATAAIFQKRLKKQPTIESATTDVWKRSLYMIYGVSALIFFRSIFRIVEYLQGSDGYSLTNEWTLYAFDAVPMFVVTLAFFWWYPGYLLPERYTAEHVELVASGRDKSTRR